MLFQARAYVMLKASDDVSSSPEFAVLNPVGLWTGWNGPITWQWNAMLLRELPGHFARALRFRKARVSFWVSKPEQFLHLESRSTENGNVCHNVGSGHCQL
jgi:hypothetical protein|tara:strand:+ start:1519 stop:1821 length:303 start_codon:yes stop_codon:yes gene_type:complete